MRRFLWSLLLIAALLGTPSADLNIYAQTQPDDVPTIVSKGGGGQTLTIQEVDGTPGGTPTTLRVTNGTLSDDGGGVYTLTTGGGGGGGGDVSSDTATAVIGELVIFKSTNGKSIGRATTTGLAKLTSGVLSAAVAGTDYQAALGFTPPPNTRQITIQGTTNEIAVTGAAQDFSADRTWTVGLPVTTDFTNKILRPPNGATLPATCTVGDIYFKTAATAGQNVYACTATNVWTLQGDGSTVTSVFGRTGAIVATTGDYTAAQVTGAVPDTRTVNGRALSSNISVTKGDVGLGNVDDTSDATKNAATAILTNKQITPRVVQLSAATGSVTAPNADNADIWYRYDISGSLTIPNPTATGSNPVHGQLITFILKSASSQTITWGANFTAENGVPLPTSTTGDGNTYDQFAFRYSTGSTKWGLVATTKAARAVNSFTTSGSTYTFNCNADSTAVCELQDTGSTGTITIAAPGGTPYNAQLMRFKFLCTNSQTLSWNAVFIDSPNITKPTTCPADTTKWTVVGAEYSTVLTKWQVLATNYRLFHMT